MTYSSEIPTIDQSVAVIFNFGTPAAFPIKTQLKALTKDGHLKLQLAADININYIKSGLSVTLEYTLSDAYYHAKSHLHCILSEKDAKTKTEMHYLMLELKDRPQRSQRRDFFRIPLNLPVSFKQITLSEDYTTSASVRRLKLYNCREDRNLKAIATHSLDISGGGMALFSPINLHKGEYLYLEFSMADELAFKLVGQVTSIKQTSPDHSCIVGIHFVALDLKDQESIVQFIFKKQNRIPEQAEE